MRRNAAQVPRNGRLDPAALCTAEQDSSQRARRRHATPTTLMRLKYTIRPQTQITVACSLLNTERQAGSWGLESDSLTRRTAAPTPLNELKCTANNGTALVNRAQPVTVEASGVR